MRSNILPPLLCSLVFALPSAQAASLQPRVTITSANPIKTTSTLGRVIGTNTAASTRPTTSSKLSTSTRTSTKSSVKVTTSTKPPTTIKTSTKTSSRTTTSAKPPTTAKTSTKSSARTTTSAKPPTTAKTSTISSTRTTTSPKTSTTTTASTGPIVTDKAYIDTIIRHHNVHRANHSATAITWSTSLAETARIISSSCIWGHNTTVNNGGYGQNIGAGFQSNSMGQFVTGSLYNSEVNSYTYYGGEPNTDTLAEWGHFSQIVWKGTTSVGCYTYDCSKTGLEKADGIPPYFTVCNYSPPGNYVGSFAQNVGPSLHHASVDASYGCGNSFNCVDAQSGR